MSELTLEQALILLDESRRHNAAMMDRLYESLGIDDSDGEVRFKWVMVKIEELKRERNELAATVEALREHVKRVFLADQNNTGNEPSLSCFHRALDEANDAAQATPQQHLRDVRAEAGRAGFIAGANWLYASQLEGEVIEDDKVDAAKNYAESVRAGEK